MYWVFQILSTNLNLEQVYHTDTIIHVMQKAIANPKENTYSKNGGKSYRNIDKKGSKKEK